MKSFQIRSILILTTIAMSSANAASVNIINHSDHDLQLVEKYYNKETNETNIYFSECIKPTIDRTEQLITFFNTDDYASTNKASKKSKIPDTDVDVLSANIYEYISNNGTCSTPADTRYWPTYYQAEPVIGLSTDDLNSIKNTNIRYIVLQNSQDTQAQKASPVVVINLGIDKKGKRNDIPQSVSTYANLGAIYYIPQESKSFVLINQQDGKKGSIGNPGSKDMPYNQNVFINNDRDAHDPSVILVK
ncbi:hypothetical protein OAO18_03835 [Francisellaceae bacterium]|nr:hypothetical protein [Francisellaceae bacterium]